MKPAPAHTFPENVFRQCLSQVKLKARTTKDLIEVRPENVTKFKEVLDKHEVKGEEVDNIIKHLNTNPGEYIKFYKFGTGK